MAAASTTVTVRILDKEFQVSCPPEEVDELNASARYLDGQMRAIRESGRVFGADRIAVMAALNITHELLRTKEERHTGGAEVQGRVRAVNDRLAIALSTVRS